MAYTDLEKERIKHMCVYYSGQVPNVPQNKTILDAVYFGTEEEVRTHLNLFVQTILKPNLINDKAMLTNRISEIDEQLEDMD